MRKILTVVLVAMAAIVCSCANRSVDHIASASAAREIEPAALPSKAQLFIVETFSGTNIMYAKTEWDEYEVVLDDGTQIEFKTDGDWKDVKRYKGIPKSVLPNVISGQIDTMFPNIAITEVEKDRGSFEIQMANRRKLYFNAEGKLIRTEIDD